MFNMSSDAKAQGSVSEELTRQLNPTSALCPMSNAVDCFESVLTRLNGVGPAIRVPNLLNFIWRLSSKFFCYVTENWQSV